jgi:hypothetical protein
MLFTPSRAIKISLSLRVYLLVRLAELEGVAEHHHTITFSNHHTTIHCKAERTKMAPQRQPLNRLNNERQAIPPNASPDVAYIRLRYDWSAEQAINPQRWQPHLLAFRGGDAYSAILSDIADYVKDRLARLEPTLCNRLDEENKCIVFQLTVQSSDKLKRHACRVDTSGIPRLNRIEDLYAGDDLRPELRVSLVRKDEETRDVKSTRPRIKIRTRDAAVPFAEDDHTQNGRFKYKFWDLSQFRPKIPTFPVSNKKTIRVTSRFIQHLEPSATAKFMFAPYKNSWDPQSIDYTSLKDDLLQELGQQLGAKALFEAPYFLGDNCDLELWVQPQGIKELFRLKPGDNVLRFLDQGQIDQGRAKLYMEIHIVSTESIPADESTDEMMNDVQNDQLHIKLTYDMKGIPKLKTMHEKSQVLHFHRVNSFQDLFVDLAEFVTTYLAVKEPEYYAALSRKKGGHCLLLRPVLIHACPLKQRAFTFDDSGIARLDTIDDLLCDEAGTAGVAETNIKPQLNIQLQLVETLKRAVTDPMVVIRSGVETKDSGGLAKFYRIGSILNTAEEDEEPSMVSTSDTIFWRVVNDPDYPTLVKAPTWTVRNLDICNPDEGEHLPATSDEIHHIDEISDDDNEEISLKHKRGLTTRVKNKTILPHINGRLLYSFKTFGKTVRCRNPMTSFPPSNLSLALRFINHLTHPPATKLSFSTVIELEIDKHDNYASIRDAIIEGFKTAWHDNTELLLKAPLKDSFDLQLWVLPQIPNGKTLYRYSGGGAELYSFLSRAGVKKGDLSLFVEVHIVDKVKEVTGERKGEVAGRAGAGRGAGCR